MNEFPASPFDGHAFIANPADGSIANSLSPVDWHVVLQRDGTIRGPRPVGRYPLRHLGLPTDVMALHVVDIQPQEEKDRYERMSTDLLFVPQAKKESQTSGKNSESTKAKSQSNDEPFVRSTEKSVRDPLKNTLQLLGVVGSIGAMVIGAIEEMSKDTGDNPATGSNKDKKKPKNPA